MNQNLEKIKYITGPSTFEQPMFRYYSDNLKQSASKIYGPGGEIKTGQNININTQYTRNIIASQEPIINQSDFNSKYFPSFTAIGDPNDYANKIDIENNFKNLDKNIYKSDHDRRRNLDYSSHILPGSMTNTGFGNINTLSKIKYGDSTRDIGSTQRDQEIDRFHPTYRNFQHELYGSTPLPQDTRYLNKQL